MGDMATLLLPFARGDIPLPGRAFLLRAEADDALGDEAWGGAWRTRLICEQTFKPAFDRLARAGFEPVGKISGTFDAGLCLLTKHKVESRANIARAWSLLGPGGLLICAGSNAIGAAGIERDVDGALGLEGRLSKNQGRVFWARRASPATPLPSVFSAWLQASEPKPVGESGFVARAGCFSPDHVDTGSRLLAEHFPDGISGRVADLGAGWGYLSVRLLQRFPEIAALDLFEAEASALEDARVNVARLVPDGRAEPSYRWWDVCAGLPEVSPPEVPPYDWIVSNPPFHEGRRGDPAIGQAFITAAWRAIRRRGKFVLVANQHLPYEAELRRRFRDVTLLFAGEGFKIYLSSNRYDR